MKSAVSFDKVSKRYTLGLTRTSLPSMVSSWVKSRSRRTEPADREFWALRDVSFDLAQGESLALVGANGAGKTTCLKLIANITKPTSGRLRATSNLSALIELGAGFHPDLTGRENIFLNGTILGLSHKHVKQRLDEIIEFSELERFIDTPVKRYSSGMYVRLGFAVASCIEPELLLVDEVLAVGDAAFQQKCLQRIRALMANGTSLIFVSHNLYLVQSACKQAVYLQRGQVRMVGDVREVFDEYENDLHKERARRFDLGDKGARTEGDLLEITKVEVVNEDGMPLDVFSSQCPAQIRIHYNAYAALGPVNLSVFIHRSDGTNCCMVRSKLSNFEVDLQPGSGTVSVTLSPLQLVGGSYFAEAWFLNRDDSMTITSQAARSDWFIVQGIALSYHESSVFEPNAIWQVH